MSANSPTSDSQPAAPALDVSKYFTPEDLALPPMDGLVAAMDRAMKDGLPASTDVIRALQQEHRRLLTTSATEDVQKIAAEMSSLAFLEGFVEKCASAGLTLEQTHAAAEGIYNTLDMAKSPAVLSGMVETLLQ